MFRVDVRSSQELQAIILAMRLSEKPITAQIRKQTKEVIAPMFMQAMTENASTRLEHRALVRNARATVSNQNITLSAGKVGRALQGGLLPKRDAHAVEFGGDRAKRKTYQARSSKGKNYTVNRRTQSQLRPRNKTGYVFFPTVADIAPRVLSLWVQTVVRTFSEAMEAKNG